MFCLLVNSRFMTTLPRGSQEERVMMLKLALAHKGASTNSGHYNLTPSQSTTESARLNGEMSIEGDEGIHL